MQAALYVGKDYCKRAGQKARHKLRPNSSHVPTISNCCLQIVCRVSARNRLRNLRLRAPCEDLVAFFKTLAVTVGQLRHEKDEKGKAAFCSEFHSSSGDRDDIIRL